MFQQLMLVGNLGNDPETRFTQSGTQVTSFRLAVNRRWTGQDGQAQEKTTWFRITAWQKQAELVSKYLSKGRRVMVLGELEEPQTWTDKEGNTRASLEVTARQIQFIDSRSETQPNGSNGLVEAGHPDEEIPF